MHLSPLSVHQAHIAEMVPVEIREPFTGAVAANDPAAVARHERAVRLEEEHTARLRAVGGQVCELDVSIVDPEPFFGGETVAANRKRLFVATGNCAAERAVRFGSTGVAPHQLDRVIDAFLSTHHNIRVEQDETSDYRVEVVGCAHEEALAIEAGYAAERERLAAMMDGTVSAAVPEHQAAGSAGPTPEA